MKLFDLGRKKLMASKRNEDCFVVPPRNDDYFTATPFIVALDDRNSCHRERSEAIFNCLSFPRYWQRLIRTPIVGTVDKGEAAKPTQTYHLSHGRY